MGERTRDEGVSIAESSNQESGIITIRSAENKGVEYRDDSSDGVGAKEKEKEKEEEEEEEEEEKVRCVIDVKGGEIGSIESENQRVCRICHLSKWEIGKDFADLVELGCGCKGELGFAHSCCAESWFKLRGNRLCEICSKTASNIKGVGDNSFMEEWNERELISSGPFSSQGRRGRGCLIGQPFCNFLMACLVIAFILPWFFHVNLF